MSVVALTEREWSDLVVQYARLHQWWTFHPYDSRRSAPGWPDLVLLRPPEALFVELKTDKGKVTDAQQAVLDSLRSCGLEAVVWRPQDEEAVFARLRHRPTDAKPAHVTVAVYGSNAAESAAAPLTDLGDVS